MIGRDLAAVLAAVVLAGCASAAPVDLPSVPGATLLPVAFQETGAATESEPNAGLEGESEPGILEGIEVFVRHLDSSEADFDDVAGGMSSRESAVGARIPVAKTQRGGVHLDLSYTQYQYTFDAKTPKVGGENPLDDAHTLSAGADWITGIDERWTGIVIARVLSSMESGAHFQHSLTGRLVAGGLYKFNDRFSAGGGALVYSQIEDRVLVRPLFLVNWKISRRFGIESRDGIQPSFTLDEETGMTAFLLAKYDSNRFRLADTNVIRNGVAEHERFRIGVGINWKFAAGWRIIATVGTSVGQTVTLDTARGNEIFEDDLDRSINLSLTLSYAF
ncbi:MAG: DUF6268 family outer membrane beta-barrel protein [Planctomycetota bacterium]|jgi:hypothetical protein